MILVLTVGVAAESPAWQINDDSRGRIFDSARERKGASRWLAAVLRCLHGPPDHIEPPRAEAQRDRRRPGRRWRVWWAFTLDNDGELAVANSLMAVAAGAGHVQGTINGYGERCGNASLCSVIPALQLKMGLACIGSDRLQKLTEVSRYVSELANLRPFARQPYVGMSAFTHKGGLHVSGVNKWKESYQHIDPAAVGNRSGVLVSELSGVSNIVHKARERGLPLARREEARRILEQVKLLESRGFQYEEAEASFELLVHRARSDYKPPFELVDFMVVVESRRRPAAGGGEVLAEATVKVRVGDQVIHTASEGDGPVNALDAALRKALTWFYPDVAQVELTDYKVRILDESAGTEWQVRVLIESGDGQHQWRTVGSSENIIEASWLALADSLEYWLLKKSAV